MVRRVQLTLNPDKNSKDRIVSEALEKIYNITHYIRILIVNDVNNNNEVARRFYKEEFLNELADLVQDPPPPRKVMSSAPPLSQVSDVSLSNPTTEGTSMQVEVPSEKPTMTSAKSLFGLGDD